MRELITKEGRVSVIVSGHTRREKSEHLIHNSKQDLECQRERDKKIFFNY